MKKEHLSITILIFPSINCLPLISKLPNPNFCYLLYTGIEDMCGKIFLKGEQVENKQNKLLFQET